MWWRFVLMSVAAATAIAPLSPSWVERVYSTSLYRTAQRLLTTAARTSYPFALFDVLIVVAIVRVGRRGGGRYRAAPSVAPRSPDGSCCGPP